MTQTAVTLRVLTADEWALFREVRLEALREAPYAFDSTLDDWQGERDTEERWRQRLTNVPFNVIAYVENAPSGMASATQPNADGTIELISMWVAPFARGAGVGDALVATVTRWARERRIGTVALEVMEDNARARAFYRRHGFVDRGCVEDPAESRRKLRMVRDEP